jgi:D-lactate dehydrogenase
MPLPVSPYRNSSPAPVNGKLKVVYFPSCINRSMGPSARERHLRPLREVTVEVLEKAGYLVIFPDGMDRLCCGTPWESKGFKKKADEKSAELEAALLKASNNGEIPVLCDTSPCLYRMRRVMSDRLRMYEPVEFIHDHLLDRLKIVPLEEKMAFHITCTSTKMGLEEKFRKVAKAFVSEPLFPEEVGCCGFAGDKGFTQPGLNRWSLRNLQKQAGGLAAGFSNSRTCEIGLSRYSGIDYRSVFYLVQDTIQKSESNEKSA